MRLLLTAAVMFTLFYFAYLQLIQPTTDGFYLFNALLFIICALLSIVACILFIRTLILFITDSLKALF
jgi:hypothetical protein